MAAWDHTQYWNKALFSAYRRYVAREAIKYRGYPDYDCSKVSSLFIIQFASSHGLPLTLWNTKQVRYISKAKRSTPKRFDCYSWDNIGGYLYAVHRRIDARALFEQNTIENSNGPELGDLLLNRGHAAIVFAVYKNGQKHPLASEYGKSIPPFPGEKKAFEDKEGTCYFRTDPREAQEGVFIDYLNHRDSGKPKKELIYYASVEEMRSLSFEIRMFKDGVVDNWDDWDGRDDPPR
jgi:hypothetical protein